MERRDSTTITMPVKDKTEEHKPTLVGRIIGGESRPENETVMDEVIGDLNTAVHTISGYASSACEAVKRKFSSDDSQSHSTPPKSPEEPEDKQLKQQHEPTLVGRIFGTEVRPEGETVMEEVVGDLKHVGHKLDAMATSTCEVINHEMALDMDEEEKADPQEYQETIWTIQPKHGNKILT